MCQLLTNTYHYKCTSVILQGRKQVASIRMEGQTANILVKCKIDSGTGAQVNIMPQRVFEHLFPDNTDSHGKYSSTCHERTPSGPGKSVRSLQVAADLR